ncbi:MAG: hypothetical protein KDD53_08430, partial [Bdellovibrionales bacterium]|nr:hypothetical protein [Bdellovibrionales bacterium]
MTFAFLSSIGFGNPLLWLVSPLIIGALIYAYRKKGRGKRVIVSSLLLMKELRQKTATRKTSIPPLRFLFELLLLLLLLFIATEPWIKGNAFQVSIIVDNSLSMAAIEQSSTNETLLKTAIVSAQEYIKALPQDCSIELWFSAPYPSTVSEDPLSSYEAISRLEKIAPAFARGDLEATISKAALNPKTSEIIVFSDRPFISKSEHSPNSSDSRVFFRRVGQSRKNLSNLSIASTKYNHAPLRDEKPFIEVSEHSFSDKIVKVQLELSGLSISTGKYKSIETKNSEVSPNAVLNFTFSQLSPYDGYRLTLSTPGDVDALSEDNFFYLTPDSPKVSATLVTPVQNTSLGLESINTLKVSVLSPQDFIGSKDRSSNVYIFHRFIPNDYSNLNAFFIAPQNESSLNLAAVSSRQQDAPIVITDWSEEHPILTYLNLPALSLKELSPLKVPLWGKPILRTNAGTALFAGEQSGFRYVASGFELLPYRGREDRLLSILLLNSLKWLFQGNLGLLSATPYQPLSRDLNILVEPLESSPPEPKAATLKSAQSTVATAPGFYFVQSTSRDKSLVGVSFYDPQESNLLQPTSILEPTTLEPETVPSEQRDVARLLLLVAFTLLCLDFLFWPRF